MDSGPYMVIYIKVKDSLSIFYIGYVLIGQGIYNTGAAVASTQQIYCDCYIDFNIFKRTNLQDNIRNSKIQL